MYQSLVVNDTSTIQKIGTIFINTKIICYQLSSHWELMLVAEKHFLMMGFVYMTW